MPKREEYIAPKPIESLNGLPEGLAVNIDWTEDAWSYGAPPPWGEYSFKLFMDKDGLVQGYDSYVNGKPDENTIYFQLNLIGKITEGEYEGVPVYTKVNTRVYRGKNISTMAGLLSKLVDTSKLPKQLTPVKLTGYMRQLVAKEPVVRGELDWRGAYKYTDSKGEEQWENVFKRYTDFPIDPETKERVHTCKVNNKYRSTAGNGDTAEVNAQTFIARFFGKGEKLVKPVQKVNGVQQTHGPIKVAEVPDLVIDAPSVTIHKPQATAATEEDLSLLLADN